MWPNIMLYDFTSGNNVTIPCTIVGEIITILKSCIYNYIHLAIPSNNHTPYKLKLSLEG